MWKRLALWKKIAIGSGATVVVLLTAAVIWIGPRFLIGIMTYGRQAREGTLQVGDPAPTAAVVGLGDNGPQQLAEWIGTRPLVLIFGSFT